MVFPFSPLYFLLYRLYLYLCIHFLVFYLGIIFLFLFVRVCAHVYVEIRGQHLVLFPHSTLFLKQGFSLHMEFADLDLTRLAGSQPRDPQP